MFVFRQAMAKIKIKICCSGSYIFKDFGIQIHNPDLDPRKMTRIRKQDKHVSRFSQRNFIDIISS